MGNPSGFMEWARQTPGRQNPAERTHHWLEFYQDWSEDDARKQGGRCMNCAVPFCMGGCPLGNIIPDFNDLVYRGRWQEALEELHSTNNFPEFTGRICPAPCEGSCVLNINNDPVTIEYIEKAIADRGWREGWIVPQPPEVRTGKSVAVVGSGPAGLAAAMQLNRAGHSVTVFERNEYIGGLLRLGIPEFKLEKRVVQRRVDQMEAEGVTFRTSAYVGKDIEVDWLRSEFDAICLTGGSTISRDLPIPGRELNGVHLAMEFLTQQNRVNAGQRFSGSERLVAEGKRVLVLGGGDTGSDCVGTAHRQGAEVVYQFELLPEPPLARQRRQPLAAVAARPAHVVVARGGGCPRLQHPHQELLRLQRSSSEDERRAAGVGSAGRDRTPGDDRDTRRGVRSGGGPGIAGAGVRASRKRGNAGAAWR